MIYVIIRTEIEIDGDGNIYQRCTVETAFTQEDDARLYIENHRATMQSGVSLDYESTELDSKK